MIDMKNISYSYTKSINKSLDSIDIKINSGEVVAFTGLSGCGKTTLTRVINGLAYKFYEGTLGGEIRIDEINPCEKELYEIGRKVGSIFQNLKSQFFAELVEDEVAFGMENYGVKREIINFIVDKSLKSINGDNLKEKSLFHLSSGERQKIAIASINALDPLIYVFDEPSANLDMESIEALKTLMLSLKKAGKTIIISEHRLYYLKDIVDKYYYMDQGKVINCYIKEVLENEDETFYRKLGLRNLTLKNVVSHNDAMVGKNHLQINNLLFSYDGKLLIDGLNYDFCSGSIYGIIGGNGVGKSTIAKLMSGLLREEEGSISYNFKKLKRNKRKDKIYYLSNNPASNLFGVSVDEELKLNDIKANTKELLSNYNLSGMEDRHPQTLSGGQKQRLTIAAAEMLDRDVFIFDEPTSGLDGKSMYLVSNRLKELQKKQKIIIVISHDFEFLMEVCTRIILMGKNRFTEFDPKRENALILRTLKKGGKIYDFE